ncbi:hypothetical protein MTX26_14095 [Bradyrhizobium sp. ISRA443]|uniref:hypothetical protein n=1 Tax=unclassified Bradyrhizobium TaxID=2631580 RepID=UPI0024787AED|nr:MULTISPECIES: hypothetical protein [unclassified Bradyrhizobium]WGR91573.1 hypothetical protein MTX20_24605 [Bradyrhizobium sp. ISRA435]WGS01874.1 hypothetical protein MTX23_14105 [Bradyrhizobium sp. ISRA436]WGS08760.1 hypothetical protein MTX18_14095 [Bradyrhizobium sp. ISRA437]WGS15648.1 hypothetical protein MTX26_14095 [Bradyrhizobium sp. ISRA443]
MHFGRFANLWILVLVAAGLLLAPVAPAFATTMPTAFAAAMPTASDDHAMADEMPCCPDQTKQQTCDGCPFLALCMLSISLPVPDGTASLIVRDPQRSRFMAHDDRLLDGFRAKPPDHPPRTNV